ncbi:hypothetical protein I6G82_08230 [Lysinibacillus macroides]|uniref:Transposase n=1 Tax=Lysinibacillus macroides TaxID=33935 RepID=A0A0N0CVK0_9BACI|nr:hypothetical protein [Lysinibacillus macroides]KOY81594.1 hypothetical protein ADM90_14460 [Lysinibacillus macroides]QPR69559.1 hypothetical protein I6G82_08230 [Lysinibacillus macroides]
MLIHEWNLKEQLQTFKQEGREEGREAERVEMAKKLIMNGQSDTFIAEITNLTMEQLKIIRKELTV